MNARGQPLEFQMVTLWGGRQHLGAGTPRCSGVTALPTAGQRAGRSSECPHSVSEPGAGTLFSTFLLFNYILLKVHLQERETGAGHVQ